MMSFRPNYTPIRPDPETLLPCRQCGGSIETCFHSYPQRREFEIEFYHDPKKPRRIMTPVTRHALRLAMRTLYTTAGFFTAVLTADIAHDGISQWGGLLPWQGGFLVFAALAWAGAVVLDGLTNIPEKRR